MSRKTISYRCLYGLALFFCTSWLAHALAPHEVMVLINEGSSRSLEIGHTFVHARKIPSQNVVYLSLPGSVLSPKAEISYEDFKRTIWEPVNLLMSERGVEKHILAWVYSADFPIRILSYPTTSLQGATFVRSKIPPRKLVEEGTFRSPLYAGPDGPRQPLSSGVTLNRAKNVLKHEMPMPSMMLAYTGARGVDTATGLRMLRDGVLADGTSPTGTIYFVVSNDIRSECRDWQFAGAAQALNQIGVNASVTSNMPRRVAPILGLQTGAAEVQTQGLGVFRPGSMAEHLTSHGGSFHHRLQTKLSAWLLAGASASAGTVTEPLALWTKFPNAYFYLHYAHGYSLLESFYLSIRSPLQILLVGEPLSRPWSNRGSLTLVTLEEDATRGEITLYGRMWGAAATSPPIYSYFLDGVRVKGPTTDPSIVLKTKVLSDGYHRLRVAARKEGVPGGSSYAVHAFHVNHRERSVHLRLPTSSKRIDVSRPLVVQATAKGGPIRIGLRQYARRLQEKEGDSPISFRMDPSICGAGPVEIQAVASYEDGMRVFSEPLKLEFGLFNQAPQVKGFRKTNSDGASIRIAPDIYDNEGDPISMTWFEPLFPTDLKLGTALGLETFHATAKKGPNDTLLIKGRSPSELGVCVLKNNVDSLTRFTSNVLVTPVPTPKLQVEIACLVFGFRNKHHFGFFGLLGDTSAWGIGFVEKGQMKRVLEIGDSIRKDKWYRLEVRMLGDSITEGWVDGRRVCLWSSNRRFRDGGVGVLAFKAEARLRHSGVAPVQLEKPSIKMDSQGLQISDADSFSKRELLLNLSDGADEQSVVVPVAEICGMKEEYLNYGPPR